MSQPDICGVCGKSPASKNNDHSECAHIDCPSRRRAWSERPTSAQYFKGPWPKNVDADPLPLDKVPPGTYANNEGTP